MSNAYDVVVATILRLAIIHFDANVCWEIKFCIRKFSKVIWRSTLFTDCQSYVQRFFASLAGARRSMGALRLLPFKAKQCLWKQYWNMVGLFSCFSSHACIPIPSPTSHFPLPTPHSHFPITIHVHSLSMFKCSLSKMQFCFAVGLTVEWKQDVIEIVCRPTRQ